MIDLELQRKQAQADLLDLFTQATNLPIGLYELKNGDLDEFITDLSKERFEPFCQLIHEFGGEELCNADQCRRALSAFNETETRLMLCHAGLYNQAAPVTVRGNTRSVLVYGEMRILDDAYQAEALARLEQTVGELNLNDMQIQQVQDAFDDVKSFSLQELRKRRDMLQRIERWFYRFIDEEERLITNVDRITHEIQTRLQAVIANAENMMLEATDLPQDIRQIANDVLFSALALDTVIQNLGFYLGDYKFDLQTIAPLIYEAKRVYEAEAKRRQVDVVVKIQEIHTQKLEISKSHMQHAINNLVHNAVKYSFRGGYGRYRFVEIRAYPEQDSCRVEINNYGVGILPEEIAENKIFEDGYQGVLTEGEFRTGAGKGLSLVKQIIHEHHGMIEVESRLKSETSDPEGKPHLTKFTVTLPYRQPKEIEK
ncbi:MAG: HAMP domain-containing histidine kinase [Anaerolineae bacterium]|nr:HAMP domain-containing histidine kinase [Anaerolineae bacterium]